MSQKKINSSSKVTKLQLSQILEISYKSACKDYQAIIDALELKRNFLVYADLVRMGIVENTYSK